jgi:hypothetical protein
LVGAVADVVRGYDILTSSETNTDEAIALGIDISKTANYKEGQLTRFVSLEYKSDLRRDGNDYLSKNAEQEVSVASSVLVSLLVSMSFAFILIRLMS